MALLPLLSALSLWVGCFSAQEMKPGPGVVNVPEGEDALLPCVLGSGQSIDQFDWKKDNGNDEVFMYNKGSYYGHGIFQGQSPNFTNRVEFFQHELKSGNASIKIKNTRPEDKGTYSCGPLKLNSQKVHITLNVGAAREPSVKPIRHESTWSLLECKVDGNPEPEVEWRNSAKEVLAKHKPKGEDGNTRVELQLKVTRSDNYTCVATQWKILHQINNTLEVNISEHSTGLLVALSVGITTIVLLAMAGLILGVLCSKGWLVLGSSEKDTTSSIPLASQSSKSNLQVI